MLEQTITPGAFLRSCRIASGRSLEEVAAAFQTEPHWAEHVRVEWLQLIEQDVAGASMRTIVVLQTLYEIDLGILADLTTQDLLTNVRPASGDASALIDAMHQAAGRALS